MKDVSNYNSVIAFLRLPLTLLVVFIHVPYTSMGGMLTTSTNFGLMAYALLLFLHSFSFQVICFVL